MNDFAAATGREYKPFEYYGHPQAERVIVLMGSAIGTCEEVVDELLTRGERSACLKCVFTARSRLNICSLPCRKARVPWRCSIEPKSSRTRGTAVS